MEKITGILGFGLLTLWIVGLGSPEAARWLTWMDGVVALGAFGIAWATPSLKGGVRFKAVTSMILSFGLFALWAMGLAKDVTEWLVWWNFAFAVAFFLLSVSGLSELEISIEAPSNESDPEIENERIRMRRSA